MLSRFFLQVFRRQARQALLSLSQAAVLALLCLQAVTSAQPSSLSANTSSTECPDDGENVKVAGAINLDISQVTYGETPKPWSIPRSSELSIPCNESNLSPRQCHQAVYTQEHATQVCPFLHTEIVVLLETLR